MIIIGLDPSFTRTGIAILNTEKKKLILRTCGCAITSNGEKKDFKHVLNASLGVIHQIDEELKEIARDDHYSWSYKDAFMVCEEPLPLSLMSAALYCLDSLLINYFSNFFQIRTFNVSFLKHLKKQRGYDDKNGNGKKNSVALAGQYIDLLIKKGWSIEYNGKLFWQPCDEPLCHDCAEAFLYFLVLATNDKGCCFGTKKELI